MPARKIKGSWWADLRAFGVRYRKRSPLNTRSGAQEYELWLRKRLASGEPIDQHDAPAGDPTFSDFVGGWFDTYVCSNNKRSEQSAKEMILRRHLIPCFGAKLLSEIGSQEIEAYKAAKLASGIAPKTVNNQLAALGKCLTTAVDWGVLASRPRIKLLRTVPTRLDFLSPRESAAVLRDVAEPMWNTMAHAALRTGMRPNELTALKWSDVDLRRATITVCASSWHGHIESPKNNRVRRLPVPPDLKRSLRDLPRLGDFVFCQADGSPLTDTMRKKPLRRICRRVGIRPITWYTFRHTFASQLAAEGVPLPVIKELMGHASIATTMRYTHVAPAALRDAVALLARAEARDATNNSGQPVGNRCAQGARRASHATPAAA